MNNPYALDKKQIRQSFNKAAPGYDDAAVLQREVGTRMLQRMELIKIEPSTILDIGCGPGTQTASLTNLYKHADIIALDLAFNMLEQARSSNNPKQKFVCGDAETLPLKNNSVDLVFSSLTLQWCENLDNVFAEIQRILKPDGLLMFSTLGPDTLHELRSSWKSADNYNHVNAFMDMHDIGDGLLRYRFSDPVMDIENIVVTYQDVFTLMKDLKTLGAHNVTQGRPTGLTGKSKLKNVQQSYEQYRTDGVLPATYEVIYGHAWKPLETTKPHHGRPGSRPGVTAISVDTLKTQLRDSKEEP